jgi:DnaJ family protein C protein 27
LIKRYCEKRFVPRYYPTLGLDYGVTAASKPDVDLRVSLYDLSGDPAFFDTRVEFYGQPQGVLLVFDLAEPAALSQLATWEAEFLLEVPEAQRDGLRLVVVGNKRDGPRSPAAAQAQLWAEQRGYRYFETSAESGEGVADVFAWLIDAVYASVFEQGSRREAVVPTFTQAQLDLVQELLAAPDDHAVLDVPTTASAADISRAYKAKAASVHPDKNRAPGSEDAFKRLLTARTRLLSTEAGDAT